MKRFDVKYVGPGAAPIAGAEICGLLAVAGTQLAEAGSVDYSLGGWVGGVKSDMFGHVLISETNSYNAAGRTTGNNTGSLGPGALRPRFWKSDGKTDEAFLALVNALPVSRPYTFTNANDADTWVKSNNFYSSYSQVDMVRNLTVSAKWSTRSDAANDSSPGTTVYQEDGYSIPEYTHLYTQADYSNSIPSGPFFESDSNSSNYYRISPQGGGSFYTCRISTTGVLSEFAEGYNSYP